MLTLRTPQSWLIAAAVAAAVLSMTGCASDGHATMKKQQYSRWNQTRIGVLAQLAQQQYEVGDYDKCRETLKQGFAIGEPAPQLHMIAARVDIEKGSLEDANQHLQKALQIEPNNPMPYYLLGVVYQRWQNFQTAHDYYELAWQHKSDDVKYLLAVIEMDISLGKADEAEKLAQDKVMYFEDSSALRLAMARLRLMKDDYVGACRYFAQAMVLNPDNLSIKRSYAEALISAGRYHDALPLFEQIVQDPSIADKSILNVQLGEIYLALHRARDARNCLLDVTRAEPSLTIGWIDLAKAELQLEDPQQALRALEVALKTSPNNVQALIVQALAQQKLGQWRESDNTLAQAATAAPNNGTVLCLQGLAAQHQGEAATAQRLYAAALAVNPADPMARALAARLEN